MVTYCSCGRMPEPSDAGVAGEIGVIGPPGVGVAGQRLALEGGRTGVGVGGYRLALDGGRTGLGVDPIPKFKLKAGDNNPGLWIQFNE